MKRLILPIGISGSGKSTLVNQLVKSIEIGNTYISYDEDSIDKLDICEVVSADDCFNSRGGTYLWCREGLYHAHKLCQLKCRELMLRNVNTIIVDNTNLTYRECFTYVELANEFNYDVELIEPKTLWRNNAEECLSRNVHKVPLETLQKMLERKESIPSIIEKLQKVFPHLSIKERLY